MITRKRIERMRIGADPEEMILATYGVEPGPFEYTGKDLHEQIRKLINQYNHEHPNPDLVDNPTPYIDNSSTGPAP